MSFRLDILKETEGMAQKFDETVYKVTVRLDDKAQQTGGVASLFLAAAFGFLKPGSVSVSMGAGQQLTAVLLIGIISILVLCLGFCLSVTWLRNGPMPLSPAGLMDFNSDLLALPDDRLNADVQENYYRDRISMWQAILEKRKQLNHLKARRLQIAQGLLAAGMLVVSGLLCLVIRTMLLASRTH